jgi:hypothetical protein
MLTVWVLLFVIAAFGVLPSGSQESAKQLLAPQRPHENVARFHDPTGDAPASADIAAVSVSSNARGFVTFKVMYAGRLSEETTTVVYLDSDRKVATGARTPTGADYAIVVWGVSASGNSFSLRRWNGRGFKEFYSSPPDVSLAGRILTFAFETSDLGKTREGRFVVVTKKASARIVDSAPDAGLTPWTVHLVQKKPVELLAPALTTRPAVPTAGATLVASIRVEVKAAIDLLVRLDVPSCKASVAGEPLAPLRSSLVKLRGSSTVTARCTWRVPRGTSGELLRASVTVALGNRSLTRSLSSRIR